MRYQESKTRSAELFRLALGHMTQHEASPNPMAFAVWYEYVAGINAKLTRLLDERLQGGMPIDDDVIARLYGDAIAEADHDAVQRISTELQRVMSGMAENASSTGEQAGAFGRQIDGLAAALASNDPSALAPMLDRTRAGAADMKGAAHALEQQVIASSREIVRLRADLSRARDEAQLDPMTQLLNRRGFDREMQAMLAQPCDEGRQHGLIMLDIDRFKGINDTRGHLMGDKVIRALGELVKACVPRAAHTAARFGGDEFAILVPNGTMRGSLELAETVRTRAKAMTIRDRKTQSVLQTITVSVGVAALQSGDEPAQLIGRADAALYQSKQAGRDRVTAAHDSMAAEPVDAESAVDARSA
jgi:diguanylate cyclase